MASAGIDRYVKHPLQVPAPWLLEVTTTSLAPVLVAAGAVPMIWVELITVRPLSSRSPMVTLVTSMKLLPVIVTLVPPASGPVAGLTPVTVIVSSTGVIELLQPGARKAVSRPAPIATALVKVMSPRSAMVGTSQRPYGPRGRQAGAKSIAGLLVRLRSAEPSAFIT